MRHKIVDDANVNVRVDIPAEDLADLIECARDAVLTIIAAATVAHIFKSMFVQRRPHEV